MPRRLTSDYVRQVFERYGYTVPDNFQYRNNITHINVIDRTTNQPARMTYKMLTYRIANNLRPVYTAPGNDIHDDSANNDEPEPITQPTRGVPKRLDSYYVRRMFEQYGYTVSDNFQYRNVNTPISIFDEVSQQRYSLTFNQLKYRIAHGRSVYLPENPFIDTYISDQPESYVKLSSFERWLHNQSEYVQELSEDEQHIAYDTMKNSLKWISKLRNGEVLFDDYNDNAQLSGLIAALKASRNKFVGHSVQLTFTDENGNIVYRHLTNNNINFIEDVLSSEVNYDVHDTNSEFLEVIQHLRSIKIEFVPRKNGKRIVAGFYPYFNVSNIELRQYGIYKSADDDGLNESCLITALRHTNMLTDEELNMIKSFTITRLVPKEQLAHIADLLHMHIHIRIIYENGNDSHDDYGLEFKNLRSIRLIIISGHYFVDEYTGITEFYIKHYNEINNDTRFMNHPRKMLLTQFDNNRFRFSKTPQGLHISKLLIAMIDNKLLIPMDNKTLGTIEWSYSPAPTSFNGISRKVIVKDVKNIEYKRKHKVYQSKHFFGYTPEKDEVDERLRELQSVVDSLPLRHHVDVSLYYKFSELMQKIMYEYGCYDDVYELSGDTAKSIRDKCIFPHITIHNGNAFYSNEKLYYIDLNGAYMSTVKYIPTGPDGNGEPNDKIGELIILLYAARINAKNNGNNKLATTLKYMMNSCWGYSIKRHKLFKHKYVNDVNKYIDTYAPFITKYKYNNDNVSGYVDTINSFSQHFTCPQFAYSVLTEFKSKMDSIKSIVNVLYENIDAILISESDYNKLVQLGYVGDELGQFKIEHIFTEIAIKSVKRYVATLDDGSKYYHCVNDTVDYNSFVNDVKNNC